MGGIIYWSPCVGEVELTEKMSWANSEMAARM